MNHTRWCQTFSIVLYLFITLISSGSHSIAMRSVVDPEQYLCEKYYAIEYSMNCFLRELHFGPNLIALYKSVSTKNPVRTVCLWLWWSNIMKANYATWGIHFTTVCFWFLGKFQMIVYVLFLIQHIHIIDTWYGEEAEKYQLYKTWRSKQTLIVAQP